MSKIVQELSEACSKLNIEIRVVEGAAARDIIDSVIDKFKPNRISGHVAIYSENSDIYPTDNFEFDFPRYLDEELIYIFFDQEGEEKNSVIAIKNGRKLGAILEDCFGIEYFVSNENISYLISVNWYSIEVLGSAKKNLSKLKNI